MGGCEPVQDLIDPAEIEAQLRADPGRGGKVGQLRGISVVHHAAGTAKRITTRPDPRCAFDFAPGDRWIAELTLERRRGATLVSSWTETRTLDRTEDAVAMRLSATFQTEIGGRGQRDLEWRVIGDQAFLSTPARDGDLWMQRASEEEEVDRVLSLADGMLQSLLDSVDGWEFSGGAWSAGTTPLRCARYTEGLSFVDRFVAGARNQSASFRADGNDGRKLEAEWVLTDGSVIRAHYSDRSAPLEATIEAPAADRIVPTTPERSLGRAHDLLTELAAAGLAEVASTTVTEPPSAPDPAPRDK